MKNFGFILAFTLALSACATTANLKELRSVTPRGTPFAVALTQNYLEFSEAEAKRYDWTDSSYFADKGLRTVYGQPVSPEQIIDWDIPADLKPEIISARELLVSLTDDAMRTNKPKQAANATFAFDCWLEELEEYTNDGTDISACQERFYEAIEALQFNALEEASAINSENTAYLIYFGYNQNDYDEASNQVVKQIIHDVKTLKPSEIIIYGHTDTSGTENYNIELSEKRALSVIEGLLEGGIIRDIISYFAFGESDPAIVTKDGVKEPKNRRVEIFFG